DRVVAVRAVQHRLRGLHVPRRDAGKPERVDVAILDGAGQLVGGRLAERRDLDGVADLVVLLGGGAGVDDDLLRALGPGARLELQRGELRVLGVVARADALAGDLLAVRADDV